MKIVLDTNVFISAVFFGGAPYQILKAWRDGKVQLTVSPEILEEYRRVGEVLTKQFPGVDLNPILGLLAAEAEVTSVPDLPEPVCNDPADDKFLACAVAGMAELIVSGDRHLLKVSGYRGIQVVTPRMFLDHYLRSRAGS